ncbi:PilZ domain-containing protein [Propionivibrio soli]|uniref:PilZ domain-containing protein n=1 Tax=Propionivibrio soli TaxID=2976531 RepID=UPI0021E76917|nr:PilZ domain-containing protein [Propionivibrio soli]
MEKPKNEKRRFPRKSIAATGELVDAIAGGASTIAMLDISLGGISFLSPFPLLRGSSWLIRFPIGKEVVEGPIQVVYCVKHSLTDAYRLGAELVGWEDGPMTAVEDYLGD